MRKEQIEVGNFVHVYNRGNRKLPIVHDDKDRWRFLQTLRYFNDTKSSLNVFRSISSSMLKPGFNNKAESVFQLEWPKDWPKHDPLVQVLSYCLMPNHYHLLLKEIREGGIRIFMHKFGTGFTNYFNSRHKEVGRIFQGPYKAKVIDNETYLQYISVYINVKNIFELYPGGLKRALKEFDKAYEWAIRYPFGSLADYAGRRNSLIIEKDVAAEIFLTPGEYKEFARFCLSNLDIEEELEGLTFES